MQRFPRPSAAVAQERFVPGRQGGTKAARSGREPETIRSTSAPISASIIVANGPGSSVVKSRILRPFSGPAIRYPSVKGFGGQIFSGVQDLFSD